MAIIFSGATWQASDLDFTATAVPGGTTQITQMTSYSPGFFNYSFNDVSGAINLRTIPVTGSWSTAGDGSTHVVVGSGLTVDANTNLTGGTAQVLTAIPTATPGAALAIIGISVAVTDLIAAAATPGGGDDAALIRQMLSGNDLAGLSNRPDDFASGGGIDLIFGNGGDDRLTLGASMDCAMGGFGKDTLLGGSGDDLLAGNQANDHLLAGAGRDMLAGGKGRDVMSGGAGSDTFIFRPGDGHDRIADFNAGLDVISFGVPGGQLADVTVTDDGADAVVTYHDNVIRLTGQAGISAADLDIRFGFNAAESRLDTFVNVFDFHG